MSIEYDYFFVLFNVSQHFPLDFSVDVFECYCKLYILDFIFQLFVASMLRYD